MNKSMKTNLAVAAIDFGTTYSGCAFSLRHDFVSDPQRISLIRLPGPSLYSQKVPTTVLLDQNRQFHSFGFEAEDHYSRLAEKDAHKDWMYIKHFKMKLHDNQALRREYCLQDDKGREILALSLFSMVINYLKSELLKKLRKESSTFVDSDVHWVLTVPAIWTNAAKQCMREAAEQAGIEEDNLTLALEPEAAAILCKYMQVQKMSDSELAAIPVGKRYMVLDAGGGTVDIVLHEVRDNGYLKEVNRASGGAWGGITVDQAFKQLLHKMFGDDIMTTYQSDFAADYIELFRNFEIKKCNFEDNGENVNLSIPITLKEFVEEEKDERLKNILAKTPLANNVTYNVGRLRVDAKVFKQLFIPCCRRIVDHVKEILEDPCNQGTDTIFMVGGFSESQILQALVKAEFQNMNIIIPHDAGSAVLKGAVIFGHNPSVITSRIARYTVGVEMYVNFQEGFHPEEKRTLVGNRWKCRDVFSKHIEAGQTLAVGEAQSRKTYLPITEDQTDIKFNVYASSNERVMYVTDKACRKIGSICLEIPAASPGEERPVTIRMIYGGTEIVVEGYNEKNGTMVQTKLDFLA